MHSPPSKIRPLASRNVVEGCAKFLRAIDQLGSSPRQADALLFSYASVCAWMLDPAEAGGGCLRNLGPHGLDMFLYLTGEEGNSNRWVLFQSHWSGNTRQRQRSIILRDNCSTSGLP